MYVWFSFMTIFAELYGEFFLKCFMIVTLRLRLWRKNIFLKKAMIVNCYGCKERKRKTSRKSITTPSQNHDFRVCAVFSLNKYSLEERLKNFASLTCSKVKSTVNGWLYLASVVFFFQKCNENVYKGWSPIGYWFFAPLVPLTDKYFLISATGYDHKAMKSCVFQF